MSRALSTTQLDIDRSFEKALYTLLLQEGWIPNRSTYAADEAGYEAAKAAIVANPAKKFCVELFGNGAPKKTTLGVPRIIITGRGFSQGSAGRDFGDSHEFDIATGKYKKFNQATPLSNYRITVELISNSATQDRLLESIRQAALPNLSYIPKHNDPDFLFLIVYQFTSSMPEASHGLTQKVYSYDVLDVSETNANLVSSNISPIKEIEVINDSDSIDQIVKVGSPLPVEDWVLQTGVWNDPAYWSDASYWFD